MRSPIHLMVDKNLLTPLILEDRTAYFTLPARVADTCLVSQSFQAVGSDRRRLGVIVGSLAVSDGSGWREIPLDDPGLYAGFHEIERDGTKVWRWTNGSARLSPSLWDSLKDIVLLRITGLFSGLQPD